MSTLRSLRALRATSLSTPRLVTPVTAARAIHASSVARQTQELTREATDAPSSLWNFTEEEEMLRETVRRFAEEVVAPKVRAMDESEVMDPVGNDMSLVDIDSDGILGDHQRTV
jgi:hypothetical protein